MKRTALKRKNAAPPPPKGNKRTLEECIADDLEKATGGNVDVKEGDTDEQHLIRGAGQSDSSTKNGMTCGENDGQRKEMTSAVNQEGALALRKCSSCSQLQLPSRIDQTMCTHCIKSRSILHDVKASVDSVLTSPAAASSPYDLSEPVEPQVNDVLIGRGSQIFNHIGNRRFRVLIEANFDQYFNPNTSDDARETIVDSIIRSISSNLPAGRFLVPLSQDASVGDDAAPIEDHDVRAILWKRASQKEAEAKVCSAFLAAGCFLVSRAAALQQMEEMESQPADQLAAENDDVAEDNKDEDCSSCDSSARVVSSQSDSSGSSLIEKVVPLPEQGTAPIQCPPRLKEFVRQPITSYFVLDSPSESSPYLVPSNYDILCGSGQNYFHHIGNRRFRILIENTVDRYHEAFCSPDGPNALKDKDNSIQKLVTDTLVSLSKCDPPGRFLGMDLTTGRWRVLNPIFASLKTETTFFECLKITQRKLAVLEQIEHTLAQSEANTDSIVAEDEAEVNTCTSKACYVMPCPSVENIAKMQSQARQMLRGTRTLESVDLSPTIGFAAMPTSQVNAMNSLALPSLNPLMNFGSLASAMMNTTNLYLMQQSIGLPLPTCINVTNTSLNSVQHGFDRMADDSDMMDAVGGMLSLGSSGARRRGSI